MTKTPKRKKPGPQGTLVDPSHVARIKVALAQQGFAHWSDVVAWINEQEKKLPEKDRPRQRASLSYFLDIVRNGLGGKASNDWVERLKLVQIYDLVLRKGA